MSKQSAAVRLVDKDIDKRFAGNSSRTRTAVLAKELAECEALSLLQQHYRTLSAG